MSLQSVCRAASRLQCARHEPRRRRYSAFTLQGGVLAMDCEARDLLRLQPSDQIKFATQCIRAVCGADLEHFRNTAFRRAAEWAENNAGAEVGVELRERVASTSVE